MNTKPTVRRRDPHLARAAGLALVRDDADAHRGRDGDRTGPAGHVRDHAELADQLAEFTGLLDRLLSTDHVDHRGEYFATTDARTPPGCLQQPRVPFVIAANGPRSMRLAAGYGQGWVTVGRDRDDSAAWWASLGELTARMDDLAGNKPLDRYLFLDAPGYSLASAEVFEERVRRAAELGFTDVITHWPRPDDRFHGSLDTLDHVAAEVMPRLR